MTCEDCIAYLDAFEDGRLAPGPTEDVRRHLRACPACAANAGDVGRIREAARRLGPIEPPARVWTRVAAAVQPQPVAQASTSATDWRQWLAAAASVALVVSSLTWIGSKLEPGQTADGVATARVEGSEAFQLAEAAYQSAIDSLEPITTEADAPVLTEPALVAVHTSLDQLDQTIGEARERLTQEPGDEISQDVLLSALESKVALLQDTVDLLDESATTGVNQ